jgi:hypothetical protein
MYRSNNTEPGLISAPGVGLLISILSSTIDFCDISDVFITEMVAPVSIKNCEDFGFPAMVLLLYCFNDALFDHLHFSFIYLFIYLFNQNNTPHIRQRGLVNRGS